MATLEKKNKINTEGALKVESPLADLLEARAEAAKRSSQDPLDPTNSRLPVFVYDENGNRVGNVWNPNKNGLNEALASVQKGESTGVYYDTKTGQFTNAPASTMTYENGKINLNVAQDVADSDWYGRLVGSDIFNQVAAAYANDPTGETVLTVSNDDGEEERTINSLLEEFAETLSKNAQDYKGNVDIRTRAYNMTNGALSLTDDDIVIMRNYQKARKGDFSNSDMYLLPAWAYEYFSEYEGFNAEQVSITADALFNHFFNVSEEAPESLLRAKTQLKDWQAGGYGYGQSHDESDKDYVIDLVRLKASSSMNDIVDELTFGKEIMTDEHKAMLTTEFVKNYALYQAITQDTPNSNSWDGFGMFMRGVMRGALMGVTEAVGKITARAERVVVSVLDGGARTVSAVDSIFSWFNEMNRNWEEGGVAKAAAETRNLFEHFDEEYLRITGEGSIQHEIDTQLKELEGATERDKFVWEEIQESIADDLSLAYANTEAAVRIGHLAGYALTQIVVTNPVGEAVGEAVSLAVQNGAAAMLGVGQYGALLNMSEFFATAAMTATTAAQFNAYMSVVQTLADIAAGASGLGATVGFAANILAQGVTDTLLENPALTDAILSGGSQQEIAEFQSAVRSNAVYNLIGELIPFAGKGARAAIKTWASESTLGAVAQAAARKAINRVTLEGRKIYENIAEFATRKKGEAIVSNAEGEGLATVKVNPEKRWQALRKEIIEVQEQIKNTKIFGEEGAAAGAKQIDELIDKRIELETTLGVQKSIAKAETKMTIVKNAGLQVEVESLAATTATLTKLSKQIGQTNLPGSFSKETSNYINDLYQAQRLAAKESWLAEQGKQLKAAEKDAYELLKSRITKYETSIPEQLQASYKEATQQYLTDQYRFYYKLNNYLSSDAGGNVISRKALEEMRANSQFGMSGEQYMPLYAVSGYEGAKSLQDLIDNPASIIQEGKIKSRVTNYERKMFSDEVVYADPNYTRELYLDRWAGVTQAAKNMDAINAVGRATSVPTDSEGNILKTPEAIRKAKRAMDTDLAKKFEANLKENPFGLGTATEKASRVTATQYYRAIRTQAKKAINRLLGLNEEGLKLHALAMDSQEVSQLVASGKIPNYGKEIRTQAQLDALYNKLSDVQKEAVENALQGSNLTIKSWNDAVTNGNLDVSLARLHVANTKKVWDSAEYKEMVSAANAKELAAEEQFALEQSQFELSKAEKELATIKNTGGPEGEAFVKFQEKKAAEFSSTVENTIVEAVGGTAESLAGNPYLEALVKEYEKAGVPPELAKEYIVYQWLFDNIDKGGVVQDIAFRFYNAPGRISEIKATSDQARLYSKEFRDAAKNVIESRLNKTVQQVQEAGGKNAIDLASTSARVDGYLKEISDLWGGHELVEAWDREAGQFAYYRVNKSTYSLVTSYPTMVENKGWAKMLARINSIARIGQITVRAASLVTQGFKDSINAIVLGGWDTLMLDNPTMYRKVAEYMGEDVVKAFRSEMTPSAWKAFLADASEQGLSVKEAIAKSELEGGTLDTKIGAAGTSSEYFSMRQLYGSGDEAGERAATLIERPRDTWGSEKSKWLEATETAANALERARQTWANGTKKIGETASSLHDARERFLRKQVYRQNYMDALAAGKSLKQARNYAQYVMENATTNFSRGFAWGSNVVRSIPYFGAALNGASSMVRLLEVDPVGITARFFTDLIIPTVGLMVLSLEDPENAEIYRNIPEYEKEGNLIWVVDGQVVTIPLPEELAKFILPFRHAVEKIAGTNDNSFGELMLNDLLNMPTISLNGVMALDEKKLTGDPSVADRMSSLAMDMFNSLAPNAARTAYIAATGKDPYTGEDYGRVKYYEDANGEYQLMTDSEYDWVNDMATVMNEWGWNVSAIMAEGVLSSIFGVGSMDIVEGLRDLTSSANQGSANLWALFAPSGERAANVLTGTARTDERQALIAWYDLTSDVKADKARLLASDGKLAKYAQDIDMAKDADELAKKTELYNAEVRNWQDSVMERVNQYNEQYGEWFTRSKFAGTLSMLTVNSSIDKSRDSDEYYNARALAVQTMVDAGYTSPSDDSIFGYIQRDSETGQAVIRYYDPLVISLSENLFWYQGEEAAQMVSDIIDLSGLKAKYNSEVYPLYQAYFDAGDYDGANVLAAAWDVELVEAIAPVVDKYTVGNLLSKADVLDILDNYTLIPNTAEAIGKGRYYSSSTGLNKRRGFSGAYLKKVYEALKENE